MSNDLLLDDKTWFKSIREGLLTSWLEKTEMPSPDGGVESFACSLGHVVKKEAGHLSIACSLNSEGDQIAKLLETKCFDDDPVLFFRIFLFLFDEFTARLEECYNLLLGHKLEVNRQPTLISVWTNRYAKHRTSILIQHHARHLFWDDPKSTEIVKSLNARGDVMFIDTEWLKANHKANPAAANQSHHAVVIVPRLAEFQSAVIDYYSKFRSDACANAKQLEQFQSSHHLTLKNLQGIK